MFRIAFQSAAYHRVALLATGLVAFVGTALVSSMAGVLSTGLASSTLTADKPFLIQFPIILGCWILGIVLFAMVSTVGVALDNRTEEITGLRLIGATPIQVRRMAAIESTMVALVAAIPGVALGYLIGFILLNQIHTTGMISATSTYSPGSILPVAAAVIVVAASTMGGYLGSRSHAERSPVAEAALTGAARGGVKTRRIAAAVLIGAGLASSFTVLAMDPHSIYSTAATGPGCVLVAVGLSMLATEMITTTNHLLRRLPQQASSVSSHLARLNLSAAPDRIRPVVTFLTLFIGVAAGTLSMQSIENTASAGVGGMATVLASINYLVVALIAAFMGIALTNNLIATIAKRGPEFTTMSLIGATVPQSQRMVLREVGAAVVISVIAGTIGALLSVIPFAIVKTGSAMAAAAPLPFLLAILAGATITLAVAGTTARRYLRHTTA